MKQYVFQTAIFFSAITCLFLFVAGCEEADDSLLAPIKQGPTIPAILSPSDNATGNSVYLSLKWTCSDPDGDSLNYSVYFGADIYPELFASGIRDTVISLPVLQSETEYYWKIVAEDSDGNISESPIWTFSTLVQNVWRENFGGTDVEWGYACLERSEGGYIVSGVVHSPENQDTDYKVLALNELGVEEWSRTYGSESDDYVGSGFASASDGGYIIAGTSQEQAGDQIPLIIKIDGSGNEVWRTNLGLEEETKASCWVVKSAPDGGLVFLGATNPIGSEKYLWLIKTDISGEVIWEVQYEDSTETSYVGRDFIFTDDGGILILGNEESNFYNFKLIKTDGIGVTEWSKQVGSYAAFFLSIAKTAEGGYILAGQNNDVMSGFLISEFLVVDNQGEELYSFNFVNGDGNDMARGIVATKDGNYVTVGWRYSDFFITPSEIVLRKINVLGVILWQRVIGSGNDHFSGRNIIGTEDGGFLIVGDYNPYGDSQSDILVIKTDSDGFSLIDGQ